MDTTETITHLSLCAGYGGIDLGLRRVLPGLRTCAYVEIEAFPCANLVAKMQEQENLLDVAPIWTDIRTFDALPFRGQVDILSGGFPCQPFSHAGQRKGTDDPRHLFPEIERIIRECEPRMLFLENVEGIISSKYGGTEQSVLHYVLGRLESMGYRAEAGLFSAEECLYPHRRKRIFIAGLQHGELGHTTGQRSCRRCENKSDEQSKVSGSRLESDGELADTNGDTCRQGESRRASGELREESRGLRRGEDEGQARQESRCRCSDERGELGNSTSNRLNTRQSDTEVGGLDGCCKEGRVQKSAGGCSELGNTHHDKHCEDRRGNEEEEGIQREYREEICGGLPRGADEQSGELGDTTIERLQGHDRCLAEEKEPARKREGNKRSTTTGGIFPSSPREPQHVWEYPRTIGDEEIITAMGGSTYGVADGNILRNQRIDSLRALGNGVVPATAARAFVTLMDKLGGQP